MWADKQTDGWTDMTQLIIVSSKCVNAPTIKMAYFPVARVCVCVWCVCGVCV